MTPLLFLIITTLIAYTIGRFTSAAAKHGLAPWPAAIRYGLAVMFIVTGISHFVGMREALIHMVPPLLPGAPALVTVTGVLELLGAVGLLRVGVRAVTLFRLLGRSLGLGRGGVAVVAPGATAGRDEHGSGCDHRGPQCLTEHSIS